jgi:hypothetical protein
VLAIALGLGWLFGTATIDAAPTQAVEVLEQSTESHFPEELVFHLRARSDGAEIVGATLMVTPGWNAPTRLLTPEDFQPGQEIDVTAVWRTTTETVPPFVALNYHWELQLADGEPFHTEPVHTEYEDPTHDWQRLEQDQVIVFWYDQPQDFGEAILEAAVDGYEHVAEITGISTEQAIRVVIYNTQEDFCAFYARGTCQDWIGGVSLTDLGVTAQWGNNLDWLVHDVIPHELAHIFYIGEIFENTWIRVPTWLNEGLAVYNERHDHSRDMALVRAAAEEDELTPLRMMSARGGSIVNDEVGTWYAQVYSLVAFLAETYGEDTVGDLVLTVADNVVFEDALGQTTGLTMVEFEMAWREWLGYPVDSIPTPIVVPTLPVTQFSLPTPQTGQPRATPTLRPQESPEASSTPAVVAEGGDEEDVPEPSFSIPGGCLAPLGLMPLAAGLVAWRLARRRRNG